ncbi:MAG: HAMP domain-containing histidine kinase [Bacteroidales bacterium]|nr:HAMP domain-containing histidine kinase [Bacteroidales bacterium]
MKLLNKTSLIIITVALFIFFLGGIIFYKIIQTMIIKRVDRELLVQRQNIEDELKHFQQLKNAFLITENKILIKQIEAGTHIDEVFKDTILFDQKEKLFSPYRLLRFHTIIDGKNFKISVFRSMLEAENLIEQIVVAMTLMLVTFILAMFFLNRYFFRKIWDDFFYSINKVQHYNLRDDPNLNLPKSEVEEFEMLNQVFDKLTDRIHKDYLSLKEFTENASHEIQTPLSIMRAKIELLLQYPGYSEKQVALISALNEAVNRLSNLNKVLILLTRIENNQFPEISTVRLKERIEYHLENFQEIIAARNITLEVDLEAKTEINVNTALADILIINLIKNAIRHNFDSGELAVRLTKNTLEISNTGPEPDIPAEQLFNRFVRTKNASESLGLGLSLVKKICDLYHFNISYQYEENRHKVLVEFAPGQTAGRRLLKS